MDMLLALVVYSDYVIFMHIISFVFCHEKKKVPLKVTKKQESEFMNWRL